MAGSKNLPSLVEQGYAFTGSVATELFLHELDGRTHDAKTGGLLGGFELAEAIQEHPGNSGTTRARVEFHGGMNAWQFVLESNLAYIATGQHTRVVGSLDECLKRFERETGLKTPPVTIVQVGVGISVVTSKGTEFDPCNPKTLLLTQRLAEDVQKQDSKKDGRLASSQAEGSKSQEHLPVHPRSSYRRHKP